MKRERIPTWIRNIVEIEKGVVCGICNKPIKFGDKYEIDHIYSVSKNGSNILDNLHIAHKKCNRSKGGKKIMSSPDQWNQWWKLIEPNLKVLRDNQIEAYFNTKERLIDVEKYPDRDFRIFPGGRPKIYCECTGAGKSILMILLGFMISKKKVLIVTPSKVIRKGNFDALIDSYNIGLIPKKVKDEVKILSLEQPNSLAYLKSADIVVSTYQKLGKTDSARVLANLRGDEFDVVLVDEAHHYKEGDEYEDTTHRDIVRKFRNSVILFFTATPFDAELNPILKNFDKDRDVIHEFKYEDAWKKGYVKYFEWTEVKPEEQIISITHPSGKIEELQLSHEDLGEAQKIHGYRTALSRSKAIKISLLHATLQLLNQRNDDLRNKAKKNIALIILPRRNEAEEFGKLIESMNNLKYRHCVIHSELPDYEEEIKKIKEDYYDIIVSVDMLKEGFDQKNITIVTLCRNIQSYVFFVQVIGRGVRSRKDIHDNYIPVTGPMRRMKDICYVITHEGLNLRHHWDKFRELDLGDLLDEQEKQQTEPIPGSNDVTGDIITVQPIVTIKDESVLGYDSDGFSNGRTPRDETQAVWFREAVLQSDDSKLKQTIEEVWRKDQGISLSKLFQKSRSLDYANRRNIPKQDKVEPVEEIKKDLYEETMAKAKILQKLLKRHVVRCIQKPKGNKSYPWGRIMPVIFNTFYQTYNHPLKAGTSKTGYHLEPRDIKFINNEVPKLIEKYKSHEYFMKNFHPLFKKNYEESEKNLFN